MREFSVPAAVTIDDATNLTDPAWDNAESFPNTPQFAVFTPAGWQDVTCARFREEIIAVARGLIAAGVNAGDRVGIISKTRYEWTLFDYAIWACGAVTVPVYETSSSEQVAWALGDSGAVACLVETAAHVDTISTVRAALPALREIWQIDDDGVNKVIALGATVDPARVEQRRRALTADDIATIIYTSGTTGQPKGCVLTHRNLYAEVGNAVAALHKLFEKDPATLLFLPLAHGFARLLQMGVVHARARTGFSSDVRNLVPDLQSFRPTFVLAVPRVFEKVYNAARQRARDEHKGLVFDQAERVAVAYSRAAERPGGPGLALRVAHAVFDRLVYARIRAGLGGRCTAAVSGGAPLGERLSHFFRGIGVTLLEGYGLTETAPAVAVNTHSDTRIGTVGRPLPGVTIRINDDGEVLVKGDVVFRGYWNDESATAEAIDSEGWFHTGDLGALDEDGYLRITGRKKELIVTASGKNVAPAVLEDRLRAHHLISQCVVIGDRQPFIAALITIDEEAWPKWLASGGRPANATVAELRDDPALLAEIQTAVDEANKAVSTAESIRVFRILPEDFTEAAGLMTPSLKVKRNVVCRLYADEISQIYRPRQVAKPLGTDARSQVSAPRKRSPE